MEDILAVHSHIGSRVDGGIRDGHRRPRHDRLGRRDRPQRRMGAMDINSPMAMRVSDGVARLGLFGPNGSRPNRNWSDGTDRDLTQRQRPTEFLAVQLNHTLNNPSQLMVLETNT